MCEHRIGSVPVVIDQQSRELIGVITDRDLCCSIIAAGLDPKTTPIQKFITLDPLTCRDGENLDNCERVMQKYQIRRVPIVDGENRVIGIIAQADLALRDKPEKVSKTVAEISKSAMPSMAA
jgi:CBS domain-containing protein